MVILIVSNTFSPCCLIAWFGFTASGCSSSGFVVVVVVVVEDDAGVDVEVVVVEFDVDDD